MASLVNVHAGSAEEGIGCQDQLELLGVFISRLSIVYQYAARFITLSCLSVQTKQANVTLSLSRKRRRESLTSGPQFSGP